MSRPAPRTDPRDDARTLPPPSVLATFAAGEERVLVTAVSALGTQATAEASVRPLIEPSALDRSPRGEPPRVARATTGGLTVAWEAATGTVNLYAGTRAALGRGAYDHSAVGACAIASSVVDVPLPCVDSYYRPLAEARVSSDAAQRC
jgi:hypothetical protein